MIGALLFEEIQGRTTLVSSAAPQMGIFVRLNCCAFGHYVHFLSYILSEITYLDQKLISSRSKIYKHIKKKFNLCN
jgi:hypothetical protein